jgi:hypothetical protein
VGWQAVALRQLSSRTVAFRPGAGLGGNRWRMRLWVDAPARKRGSEAVLTIYRANGKLTTRVVRLDSTGYATTTAPFSTPEVVRVELALVNASTRYRCDEGTNLSCEGTPRDSGMAHKFRVRLYR